MFFLGRFHSQTINCEFIEQTNHFVCTSCLYRRGFLYVKLLGVAGSRAVVALIALNVLTTHAEATWWALETIATISIRLIETHRAD